MRLLVAIVLGCLSGFLLYMSASMILRDPSAEAASGFALVVVVFFGGWIGTTYLLQRGARNVSRVFTRGALVGAAEWLLVGLAGVVLSGKVTASSLASTSGQTDAGAAGAAIGGGLFATIAGGISIVMAVVCLIVFAIAHFAGREMSDTTSIPTRKCPECAEMIQAEARRCKHCGSALTATQTA